MPQISNNHEQTFDKIWKDKPQFNLNLMIATNNLKKSCSYTIYVNIVQAASVVQSTDYRDNSGGAKF